MFPILGGFSFHKPHPKSKFTEAEDENLAKIVAELGSDDWQQVARLMPDRNARQCRDRWVNYLSPEVANGPWTAAEEQLLVDKYKEFGAVWRHIATFFPARTDINIKSRWQLMQRRARKVGSCPALLPMLRTAGVSADPLPVPSAPPARPDRPPTPPNKDGAGDADLWGSLLMNDDTGMGCMFDQWY
jgi:hypothetical protein